MAALTLNGLIRKYRLWRGACIGILGANLAYDQPIYFEKSNKGMMKIRQTINRNIDRIIELNDGMVRLVSKCKISNIQLSFLFH